ncbi:MAG: T9SS type A sorting domain-containing protein, partial [Bacteroidetes bacterium]|nr:T9SS type A sorting domain-containing protein [Bacteroidota bacterium]
INRDSLTDFSPFVVTSNNLEDIISGIASQTAESVTSATIFPNPAADYVNINVTIPSVALISNMSGQVVFRSSIPAGTQTIGLAHLPSGLYNIIIVNPVSGNGQTYQLIRK